MHCSEMKCTAPVWLCGARQAQNDDDDYDDDDYDDNDEDPDEDLTVWCETDARLGREWLQWWRHGWYNPTNNPMMIII